MIRPLSDDERDTLNREDPSCRVSCALLGENNHRDNLRHWAITERAGVALQRAWYRQAYQSHRGDAA